MQVRKILYILSVLPEPKSSAAGLRTYHLLETMLFFGYEVHLAYTSKSTDYSELPVGVTALEVKLNDDGFDSFLKQLKPDIVFFDRFYLEEQFGWRVVASCPEAIRIIDTQDLHALRDVREKQLLKGQGDLASELKSSELAMRELAAMYRSDVSMIISDVEMELLKTVFTFPDQKTHYYPLIARSQEQVDFPNFETTEGFTFVGNYQHKPNADAFEYLVQAIWPQIRKGLPDAHLYLYGAYPGHKQRQKHQPENGIFVMGRAEDLKVSLQKHRVLLAPLRFGAGMKGKIMDALQLGLPVITSPIGAEGFHPAEAMNIIDWQDPEEFAREAIEVYINKLKWLDAREKGMQIIQHFQNDRFTVAMEQLLQKWIEKREELRESDFTGKMMLQHRQLSTRYLARWINAKNELLAEKNPPKTDGNQNSIEGRE